MRAKRVIITGATGFVGANLVRRLLQDEHDVHLIVRHGFTDWRIKSILSDVHIHKADLINRKKVKNVVDKIKPDWVFHLAAYGAYQHQADMAKMMNTNVLGTTNLIEACLDTGFESFINAGSSSEYGIKDHAPNENEVLEPNSPYAITKAYASQFCRYAAIKYNINITTLRLYSVYGPYEDENRFIPTLIRNAQIGRLPYLVAPETARDYVYVDDVCEAFLRAARCKSTEKGAIYNVGSGAQRTVADVVAVICRLFHIEDIPVYGSMPSRQWDTSTWVADAVKARHVLKWSPYVSFEDGLIKTEKWIELTKNLICR